VIWTIGAVVLADNGNTPERSVKAEERGNEAVDNHMLVPEKESRRYFQLKAH